MVSAGNWGCILLGTSVKCGKCSDSSQNYQPKE